METASVMANKFSYLPDPAQASTLLYSCFTCAYGCYTFAVSA